MAGVKARGWKNSVSNGVAAPDEKYLKVDEVLKAADTALYKEKQNGCNCVATV